jgi:hypothetical protein
MAKATAAVMADYTPKATAKGMAEAKIESRVVVAMMTATMAINQWRIGVVHA